jgi:addiction module RelB/DinJ family antitoxin
MSLVTRTAIIQARVSPEIKYASEHILRRIGLNLTEALELFLRRIIVDEKLPFEVIALNNMRLMEIAEDYERQLKTMKTAEKGPGNKRRSKMRPKRE